MRLALFTSIIFIFTFLHIRNKAEFKTTKDIILVISFVAIVIFNYYITYNYVNTKSSFNYSTYLVYNNSLYTFQDLAEYEIEDIQDIGRFKNIIEGIYNQSSLLEYHLTKSNLRMNNNEKLSSQINNLNQELRRFLVYHRKLIGSEDIIDDTNYYIYEELKIKILEFGKELRAEVETHTTDIVGISQYYLDFKEEKLDRLDTILDSITKKIDLIDSK